MISGTPSLYGLLDEWVTSGDPKSKTVEFRTRSARIIRNHLDDGPITKVDWSDAKSFIDGLEYSSTSVNGVITAFNGACMLAEARGIIRLNPTKEWKRVRQVYKEKELPESDQVFEIIEYLKKKNSKTARLMEFMIYSGTRVSEASSVKWEDISEEFISVRCAKVKGGDTVTRKVPILPEMDALLDRIGRKRSGDVFLVKDARRVSQALGREFGIKWSHHYCRHLFITQCIESGIDAVIVSKWVGHSSTAMVNKVYFKLRDEYSLRESTKITFKKG